MQSSSSKSNRKSLAEYSLVMVSTRSRHFSSQQQAKATTLQSSRFFGSKKGIKTAAVALSLAATAGMPHTTESLTLGGPTSPHGPKNSKISKRKSVVVSPEAVRSKTDKPSPKKKANTKTTGSKKKAPVARTQSFGALSANKFPELVDTEINPHTVILGSHPSIASLEANEYYGHPMNAFWWIAGDCLGFRRASGISQSSGKAYKFTPSLSYDEDSIIPYEKQIQLLVSKGFCLWDVVGSCERPGSLDQDIREDVPNDIRGFCKEFPSIRRIVFANGGTGSALFAKHFKDWLKSGELKAADDELSQKAFTRALAKAPSSDQNDQCITLVSAISVSPAAATYTYEEKRDFWDENVYRPGLEDFENN